MKTSIYRHESILSTAKCQLYMYLLVPSTNCFMCVQANSRIGYTSPTPIQAKTIPLAVMGKDICACAAIGTGEQGGLVVVLWASLADWL